MVEDFQIAIYDSETWSRLVLPFPTDGVNCTCKKYNDDIRVSIVLVMP